MFCLAVLTQYRRVTDERTDRRTSCDNIISRRERNLEVRSASARHWAETTAHKRHFRRHSFIAKHRELSTPHKWVFNPQSFQDPLIFAPPLPDIRYSTSGSSLVDTRKYFLRCMQHYTKNHLDPHELIYTPPTLKYPTVKTDVRKHYETKTTCSEFSSRNVGLNMSCRLRPRFDPSLSL